MQWCYTPYALPYFISGIVSFLTGIFAWKRRKMPGALPFSLFLFTMAEWSTGNAIEMLSADLAGKIFWAHIEYIGIASVAPTWFATSIQFSGQGKLLTRRNWALLLIIPIATQFLVWTNHHHGLLRYNIRLDTSGPYSFIAKTYGPWFWILTAYSYMLILAGVIIIVRSLFVRPQPYRGQAIVVIAAAIFPWIGNILYVFRLNPFPGLDFTPIAFTLTGLMMMLGLFRYKLLDIVPIAWATVVEGMDGGVIVVDWQNRIVDLNPAAQRIIELGPADAMGRQIEDVLHDWRDIIELCSKGTGTELVSEINGSGCSYELHFSSLLNARGDILGRLIMIQDVTEDRHIQAQLVEYQRSIAIMEERERLARGLYDNLGLTLGFLRERILAARERLATGQLHAADSYLEEFITVASNAYDEVREYIMELKGQK